MESTGFLFSTSEKTTFLGNLHHTYIDYHHRTLFRTLGHVFRIIASYGEVRSIDFHAKYSRESIGI